jgi:flagellar biosynthesis chaperone FliJ
MIKIIFADFIHIFQPPTADEMVREELEQARRELLKAHSAEEYARSMSQYHQERITRLTNIIEQGEQDERTRTRLAGRRPTV